MRDRRYWSHIGERLGGAPPAFQPTVPGGIWLHAVSVGEVISAVELLRQLREQFPSQRLYVSVTTVAGRQIAAMRLKTISDGIFYAPVDLCWAVRRVLRRIRPQLVVVMETEIWPNLYREAKRFGCGLVVINGRISDKAFPRYMRLRGLVRATLRLSDAILVQSRIAMDRYLALGAPASRVRDAGNLKYDFRAAGAEPPAMVRLLAAKLQPSAIWIAASTMPPAVAGDPDEDDVVIEAFRALASNERLLLMLAPRRPERFDPAAEKLERAGVRFLRRSELTAESSLSLPGVLLVDTMGELSSLFALADVVFMGGTFAHRGGHNILEPAFFAKPVIIGPHMENFPDIAEEFRAHGGVYAADNPEQLARAVSHLLTDVELRTRIGETARRLTEGRRGATARAVAALIESYSEAMPRKVHSLAAITILGPLSLLWRAGVAWDRRRKLAQSGSLRAPVISVGGIVAGGCGKTPFTEHITRWMSEEGFHPAILTRGYKRGSPERSTVLAAGAQCPVARTGDEAQILLRAGTASLGIGADRLATGRELERQLRPGVIVLDDGFQHWRVRRDADIVMLDALDPFGGEALIPLGRLREPLSSLQRASAFVVARASIPTPWKGLERRLREYQPDAPVFYSRVKAVEWVAVDGTERSPAGRLPSSPAAVFCGLGNPASFHGTLHDLGIEPVFSWAFGDHHHYRTRELRRLAHQAQAEGARILLTTGKDLMNLPADAAEHVKPLRIYWLRMRIEMEREEEFFEWLRKIRARREDEGYLEG